MKTKEEMEKEMDEEFSHLLRTPNEDELWSGLRREPEKWTLYPATDEEIRRGLLRCKFPSADFERVSKNVVIADGAAVVCIKACEQANELYWLDYPPQEWWRDHLEAKRWATKEVIADIERAFKILGKKGETK